METFLTAFDAVLPLFLIILTGLLFSKTKVASLHWIDILNKYALWIGYPALIIHLISTIDFSSGSWFQLIWVNSVYIVLCILISFPYSRIFRFTVQRKRTLFLVIAYGNVAYLGIPVLQLVMGDAVLPVAGVLSAVYVFWLLTLGLILVETNGEEPFHPGKLASGLMANPLLISVFTGLLLALFHIRLPGVIDKSISMMSASVTPVVLFSLGIFIGFQKTGHWREWKVVAVFTLFIMVILPGLYYLSVSAFPVRGFATEASILEAAMPLGLTPYALSHHYKLDTTFAARVVIFSTILSLVILPVWIAILGF